MAAQAASRLDPAEVSRRLGAALGATPDAGGARRLRPEDVSQRIARLMPKPSALGAFAGSALEGAADVAGAGKLATEALGGALGTSQETPFFSAVESGLRGAAQTAYPDAERGRGGFLSEELPAAMGSSFPSMAAGIATGGMGVSLVAGAQNGVPLYHEVLDKTGDKDKAMLGLLFGQALGPLEQIGATGSAMRIAKAFRKADDATGGTIERGALRIMLQGAATEPTQEIFEQGALDKVQELLTGEDLDNLQRMRDVAPASLAIGLLFGGGEAAVRRAGNAEQPAQPATAAQEAPGDGQPEQAPATPEEVAWAQRFLERPEPKQELLPPTGDEALRLADEANRAAGAQGVPGLKQPTRKRYPMGTKPSLADPAPEMPKTEDEAKALVDRLWDIGKDHRVPMQERVKAANRIASQQDEKAVHDVYTETVADWQKRGMIPSQVEEVIQPEPETPEMTRQRAIQALDTIGKAAGLGDGEIETAQRAMRAVPAEIGIADEFHRLAARMRRRGIAVNETPRSYEAVARQIMSTPEAEETPAAGLTKDELAAAKANFPVGRQSGKLKAPAVNRPGALGSDASGAAKGAAGSPSGAVELFSLGPSPFGKSPDLTTEKLKAGIKRWLTSPGDTPQSARRELELAKGSTDAEILELSRNAKALDRAMRKSAGKEWRGGQAAKSVDLAFEGDANALSSLSPEAQSAVADMRAHLDRLIRSQVKAGGVIDPNKAPDFAKKILESQGTYSRRQYKANIDPEWANKVPADVRQRTFDLFRSWAEYASASDAEINAELDAILQGTKERADSPWKHIAAGKLGRKDLSIYKRRKDIPAELRAFLGEVDDPSSNYAASVIKIASVVAKHEAYTNIRAEGLGKWLHEKPTGKHTARLSSENSPGLRPLDGLFTTPEIKKALTEVTPQDTNAMILGLLKANAYIKWGKVLGQPWGISRNLLGNVTISIANGHLPTWFKGKEWKAAMLKGDLAEAKRLTRLGIIGSGTSSAEWRDLQEATKKTPAELAVGDQNLVRKGMGKVEQAFEAADNAPKIRGFYAEEAALKKAGYSDAEAEALAADRVRDLYPTRDRMAQFFKAFRKQPILGNYFAFRAEVIRTTGNRLRLIAKEIKSDNPAVRAMGYRRAAGQLIATTAAPTIAYAINMLNGVDAEEDKEKREFIPPWDKNSRLIWFGGESKGSYLDLSDVDPFTTFTDPLMRVIGGGEADEAMKAWADEDAKAFFGWSPVAQLAVELSTGETSDGRPIDDPGQHVWKAIQPGFVSSYVRGQSKGFSSELVSMVTGFRRYDFDAEKSFGFDVSRFSAEVGDTTRARNRRISKSPEDEAQLKALAERTRKELFEDMSDKARAAIRLGVPVWSVRKKLDEHLSREVTNAILGGSYLPYREPKK